MELGVYALIYWNDNFKSEVKKMLSKKVVSTMFLLSALLVGCSSTNGFSDDKVKNNKEKVELVEEQKEQNKESNENESIEENSNTNDQVTSYNEQIESNSNDTYVPEVKETPQPEDSGEREIILVPETIPACDDTVPYGAYTSYDEANSAAKAALREAAIRENWFSSHYGIDTHQTECGTIYYTYWYEEFIGN